MSNKSANLEFSSWIIHILAETKLKEINWECWTTSPWLRVIVGELGEKEVAGILGKKGWNSREGKKERRSEILVRVFEGSWYHIRLVYDYKSI